MSARDGNEVGSPLDVRAEPSEFGYEQRRPGRRDRVSPALLPLLRGPPADYVREDGGSDANRVRDDTSPLRGLAVSLAASIGIYVTGAFIVGWLLRHLYWG